MRWEWGAVGAGWGESGVRWERGGVSASFVPLEMLSEARRKIGQTVQRI